MPDELIDAKEEAAEAAQDAANAQETVAEIVTEDAEAAIERAEEREEIADAVREAVVDAAIEDEKHRAVMELQERISECQSRMEMQNTETTNRLATLETTIQEMALRLPPLIQAPSNLPPIQENVNVDGLENPIAPEEIQEAPAEEPKSENPVARKRRIRLL